MNERLFIIVLLVAAAALFVLGTVQAAQLQDMRTTIVDDINTVTNDAPTSAETTTPPTRTPSAPAPTMVGGC